MTKAKAQLRAEAVERLKNCVAARFDAESIVIALTSGRHGQSDWSIECGKLIDLLTDEEPNDALAAKNDTCYNVSKSPNGYKCSNCGAEWQLEDYDSEPALWLDGVAYYPHYCQLCGMEIKEPDETSQVPEQDTREKLEADIRVWKDSVYSFSDDELYARVKSWLDRQAAITEHEVLCHPDERDEQIAELQADNDYLRDINEKLGREVRDWRGEAKNQRNNFEQATEARKHWQRKYENLKAASYSAKATSDESELARELGKALAERDMYRDKLGRAIDAAHEIVRMVDE